MSTTLRQPDDEKNSLVIIDRRTGDLNKQAHQGCGTRCAQQHFCCRCGWELKLARRVPLGTGFLCVACAGRKPR